MSDNALNLIFQPFLVNGVDVVRRQVDLLVFAVPSGIGHTGHGTQDQRNASLTADAHTNLAPIPSPHSPCPHPSSPSASKEREGETHRRGCCSGERYSRLKTPTTASCTRARQSMPQPINLQLPAQSRSLVVNSSLGISQPSFGSLRLSSSSSPSSSPSCGFLWWCFLFFFSASAGSGSLFLQNGAGDWGSMGAWQPSQTTMLLGLNGWLRLLYCGWQWLWWW